MGLYRKLPTVVEARQLTKNLDEARALALWCSGRVQYDYLGSTTNIHLAIETSEGTLLADPGDWIVEGVLGTFYPCKPEVFELTHEPAP